jgi:hypothetical protein
MDTRRRSPPGRSYSRARAGCRFADFIDHLRMPRAVLASRLKTLTAAGVMTRVAGEHHLEYQLTPKGAALWPVVLSLMSWRCFRGALTAWELPDDAPSVSEGNALCARPSTRKHRIASPATPEPGCCQLPVVSVRRSRSEWEI